VNVSACCSLRVVVYHLRISLIIVRLLLSENKLWEICNIYAIRSEKRSGVYLQQTVNNNRSKFRLIIFVLMKVFTIPLVNDFPCEMTTLPMRRAENEFNSNIAVSFDNIVGSHPNLSASNSAFELFWMTGTSPCLCALNFALSFERQKWIVRKTRRKETFLVILIFRSVILLLNWATGTSTPFWMSLR